MLNCLSDSAVAVAVAAADVDAENGRSEAETAAAAPAGPLRGGVLGGLPTAPFLALLRVLTIFKLGERGVPRVKNQKQSYRGGGGAACLMGGLRCCGGSHWAATNDDAADTAKSITSFLQNVNVRSVDAGGRYRTVVRR
mmetsp:Transcript_10794/g.19972  ORF Transcript_10794/g.19972 Transcript_10794/m.19972 type:complete len:139 (-) Transcript_10794:253-669(-)